MRRLSTGVSFAALGLSLYNLTRNRRTVPVIFNRSRLTALLPSRGSSESAGYDVYAPYDFTIPAGEVVKVDSGLILTPPLGYYISLQTRSSLSINHGIVLANGTEGVIDSDYHEPIVVALLNRSSEDFHVSRGDRIAQLLIKDYSAVRFVKAHSPWSIVRVLLRDLRASWSQSGQRQGGLGSTGT